MGPHCCSSPPAGEVSLHTRLPEELGSLWQPLSLAIHQSLESLRELTAKCADLIVLIDGRDCTTCTHAPVSLGFFPRRTSRWLFPHAHPEPSHCGFVAKYVSHVWRLHRNVFAPENLEACINHSTMKLRHHLSGRGVHACAPVSEKHSWQWCVAQHLA